VSGIKCPPPAATVSRTCARTRRVNAVISSSSEIGETSPTARRDPSRLLSQAVTAATGRSARGGAARVVRQKIGSVNKASYRQLRRRAGSCRVAGATSSLVHPTLALPQPAAPAAAGRHSGGARVSGWQRNSPSRWTARAFDSIRTDRHRPSTPSVVVGILPVANVRSGATVRDASVPAWR